jgi:hypothetical protein
MRIKKLGWMALLTAVMYEAARLVPPRIIGHVFSRMASAVWGS